MGTAAILFNGAEQCEQIIKKPSAEGPIKNLLKIGQADSEKKKFKDYMILYMPRGKEKGPPTPTHTHPGTKFCNKNV